MAFEHRSSLGSGRALKSGASSYSQFEFPSSPGRHTSRHQLPPVLERNLPHLHREVVPEIMFRANLLIVSVSLGLYNTYPQDNFRSEDLLPSDRVES